MRLSRSAAERTARICLGLAGGYAVTATYIGLVAVLLSLLGFPRGEATSFGILSGVVVYLGVIIWTASALELFRATVLIISISILGALLANTIA